MLLTPSSKAILLLLSMIFRIFATGSHCCEKTADQNTDGIDTCNHFIIPSGTSVTWDAPMSGTWDELIIENGATLTITSQLYVPENTFISVQRGGKLVVDGGLISGTCGMWGGINVWGTSSQPPNTFGAHGKVELENGAVIENAICGIRVVRLIQDPVESGPVPDYSYTGGQVYADSGTVFRNCQTGVRFYAYGYGNWSRFIQTTFETTEDWLESGYPAPVAHAYLEDVNGIEFKGCDFINHCDFLYTEPDERGIGIYSFQSNYYVDEHCAVQQAPCPAGDATPTTFTRLWYGIKGFNTEPNVTFSVKNSVFDDNIRGLYAGVVNNISVVGCDFRTYEYAGPYYEEYGLYLDQCTGYEIEENTFHNDEASRKGIGIIVNNSGTLDNEIYNNYFDYLQYGMLAQNQNRGVNTGLRIKCNEFMDCGNDLAVTKDITSKPVGIAEYQGSSDTLPDAPAGNRFSWTGPQGTYTDINNLCEFVTYYYHVSALANLEPIYFDSLKVDAVANYPAGWDLLESCPSHQGGGSGGMEEMMGLMQDASRRADSVSAILQALEDGGDTDGLKTDVDLSAPSQSTEIYNDLMAQSPYVSDSVMGSAVEKENVLVDAMIRDIMVANPESAGNDELIEKLGQRNNPPPAYMMGQILQGRSLVSVYGELLSSLARYSQTESWAREGLKRICLTDTVNPPASADTLKALLATEGNPRAMYWLAFVYLREGNTQQGLDVLNSIPGACNLSAEELQEYNDMKTLYDICQGTNLNRPDSAAVSNLLAIAGRGTNLAGAYSRNILLNVGEYSYSEPILLPDGYKSAGTLRYEGYLKAAGELKYLEVYPNPAAGNVILSWKPEGQKGPFRISIASISGDRVMDFTLQSQEDKLVVNTSGMKPGVYAAGLYAGDKLLDSVKFTVMK